MCHLLKIVLHWHHTRKPILRFILKGVDFTWIVGKETMQVLNIFGLLFKWLASVSRQFPRQEKTCCAYDTQAHFEPNFGGLVWVLYIFCMSKHGGTLGELSQFNLMTFVKREKEKLEVTQRDGSDHFPGEASIVQLLTLRSQNLATWKGKNKITVSLFLSLYSHYRTRELFYLMASCRRPGQQILRRNPAEYGFVVISLWRSIFLFTFRCDGFFLRLISAKCWIHTFARVLLVYSFSFPENTRNVVSGRGESTKRKSTAQIQSGKWSRQKQSNLRKRNRTRFRNRDCPSQQLGLDLAICAGCFLQGFISLCDISNRTTVNSALSVICRIRPNLCQLVATWIDAN